MKTNISETPKIIKITDIGCKLSLLICYAIIEKLLTCYALAQYLNINLNKGKLDFTLSMCVW